VGIRQILDQVVEEKVPIIAASRLVSVGFETDRGRHSPLAGASRTDANMALDAPALVCCELVGVTAREQQSLWSREQVHSA
jgi:hypothetical protein